MKRSYAVAGALMLGLILQAAEGKHIAKAVLQTRAGATVASAQADSNGCVRFTNVPPGEYQLVVTSPDGRSVTLADLDGDGHSDISIQGSSVAGITGGAVAGKVSVQDLSMTKSPASAAPPAAPGSGGGAGKVNVQDLSITKKQAQGGALPGGAVVSAGVVSPRDAASGLPTGKRMHKPMVCLVDWDLAKGKGGYASERAAQAEGQALPDNVAGRCVVKVVADEHPGTIEVLSWSWGASQSGKHQKTGHVTLLK